MKSSVRGSKAKAKKVSAATLPPCPENPKDHQIYCSGGLKIYTGANGLNGVRAELEAGIFLQNHNSGQFLIRFFDDPRELAKNKDIRRVVGGQFNLPTSLLPVVLKVLENERKYLATGKTGPGGTGEDIGTIGYYPSQWGM